MDYFNTAYSVFCTIDTMEFESIFRPSDFFTKAEWEELGSSYSRLCAFRTVLMQDFADYYAEGDVEAVEDLFIA